MKDMVTNQQLYEAIMNVERNLGKRMDVIVETRITPLEIWRANIMGQIAVVGAVIIFVVNVVFDYIREKIKNI